MIKKGAPSVLIALALVIVLHILNRFSCRSLVESQLLVGFFGVLGVILGAATGSGLAALVTAPWSSLIGIGWLIELVVGINGTINILESFRYTSVLSTPEERVVEAMGMCGVPLLSTMLVDVVLSAVCLLGKFGGLRIVGVNMCFGFLFIYLFHLTWTVSILLWDAKRQGAGRIDICCCCKGKELSDDQKGGIGNYVGKRIASVIGCGFIRVIIILGIFGLFCAGAVLSSTKAKFDVLWYDLVPEDTRQGKFLRNKYTWIGYSSKAVPISFTFVGADYSAEKEKLLAFHKILKQNQYLDDQVPFWLDDFIADGNNVTDAKTLGPAVFAWAFGGRNEYLPIIRYDTNQIITHSQIRVYSASMENLEQQAKLLKSIRAELDEFKKTFNGQAFVNSIPFTFFELGLHTVPQLVVFSASALGVLAFLSLTLFTSPAAALYILMCAVMIEASVIGWVLLYNVRIDLVLMFFTLFSCAIAVDYSVYFTHAFIHAPCQPGTLAERRQDRLSFACQTTAGPMAVAAIIGILAVSPAAAYTGYMWTVFRHVLTLTFVFGLGYGCLLMPALMAVCGPEIEEQNAYSKHPAIVSINADGTGEDIAVIQPAIESADHGTVLV
eukprot:Filipodium_phascolosomae@DN1783_c0_g1_i1.p1